MRRRSRHALDNHRKDVRTRAKRGLDTVLRAMDIVLDPERVRETAVTDLYNEIDEPTLRQALNDCRAFQRLEDRGLIDELCTRHSQLKRYLPTFLELPFQAETGSQPLLTAIVLARRFMQGEIKTLPTDAPIDSHRLA